MLLYNYGGRSLVAPWNPPLDILLMLLVEGLIEIVASPFGFLVLTSLQAGCYGVVPALTSPCLSTVSSCQGAIGIVCIAVIMVYRIESEMCAPHVLNLAEHVGLVLLPRTMVVLLLVVVDEVLRTVVVVIDVGQLGHHAACIPCLGTLE